jgi:hypothetical protein
MDGRGIGWLRKMHRRSIPELQKHDQPQAQLAYRANPANAMKLTRAGSKVPSAAGTFLKQLGPVRSAYQRSRILQS